MLLAYTGAAHALQSGTGEWELNEIEITPSGTLQRTSGDPYIIFPEIPEQGCSLSGIHFELKFEKMPHKPFLMELFWRPTYEGFGEDRKLFFILHPDKEGDTLNFIVPLDQQAGYKQIRLDLPSDLDTAFSVEKYAIIPAAEFPENVQIVEGYSRLSMTATRNPAIIIPFLVKTLRHGMVRMAHDPAFLIFWLLSIGGLLAAHRVVIRSAGKQK